MHDFNRETYGEFAIPYLKPYLSKEETLHKHYEIRRQDGNCIIGNSVVNIDKENNITIKVKHFKATRVYGIFRLARMWITT